MNDAAKMFSVLAGVTTVCGLLLAGAHDLTHERITIQQLRYVKGPAVKAVLADATNDPLADRRVVTVSDREVTLFIGKKDSIVIGIAVETEATGYSGPVRIITGFDPKDGTCKAVAIAQSQETPGIGSRTTEASFTGSFAGLALDTRAALRNEGGTVDAVSGATISSRAVCSAVAAAQALFETVRPALYGVNQ